MPEKKAPLTIRIPKRLHAQARHKSIDTGISLNDVVIKKLIEWVQEKPEKRSEQANPN